MVKVAQRGSPELLSWGVSLKLPEAVFAELRLYASQLGMPVRLHEVLGLAGKFSVTGKVYEAEA
jgi:hypothetical protein